MKRRQLLFVLFIIMLLTACGRPSEEQVRSQMEKYLYEKYGEEFVVDRIGMRSANEQKFYQARIYPKSIIGTEKEEDSYYYGSASLDIDSFGRLSKGVGDSYWEIKMNDDAENYLFPKAKELFGERIRLKTSVKYQERIEDSKYFAWYKKSDFKEVLNNAREDQENRIRLELTLYLYIFNRIDSEEEKEERREQIFEFIQYLKVEGLFEYTKFFITFTDEIILSPNFEKYEWTLNNREEERIEIEKKIREDLINIDKKDLIGNINSIRKNDLKVNRNGRFNQFNQSDFFVISMEMLKIDKYGRMDEAKINNTIENHYYNNKEDIEYSESEEYIF